MINYIKFIIRQLGHMQLSNYMLWAFSLGVQLMIFLSAPITSISILTFIGTSLGVLCVVAINATRSINGWLGILSGICFIIIGFSAKNYLSIGEQLAYIATLDIPVLCSVDWNKDLASKIRHFGLKQWIVSLVFTALVWFTSMNIIGSLTNDPRPAVDALSFAICLTAGVICFMRYSNQYIWWLASGIIQIILWAITAKQGDASIGMLVNSSIYVLNDIFAFTLSPWYNNKARSKAMSEDQKLA